MSPTYANLTFAHFEENLYEIIVRKFQNIKAELVRSWNRYLDYCFIFWKCPWGNINNLHNLLQNLRSQINFTMEHIKTKWPNYHRHLPQSHLYPTTIPHHFQSHHSKTCLKSITSYHVRICTIDTNKNLRKTRIEEIHVTL